MAALGRTAGRAAVFAAAGATVPRSVPSVALRERVAFDGALLEPVGPATGEGIDP